MREIEIRWRSIGFGEGWEEVEPDIIVWVDVRRFDLAWERSDQHIGPGGANSQDDRYVRVSKWFEKNAHCDMPCACIDDNAVIFSDGRHRFSWLRDQGVTAMPMQVSPEDAPLMQLRYGSELRQSLLRFRSGD